MRVEPNPAYAIRDLLLSAGYPVDEASFERAARYCDARVLTLMKCPHCDEQFASGPEVKAHVREAHRTSHVSRPDRINTSHPPQLPMVDVLWAEVDRLRAMPMTTTLPHYCGDCRHSLTMHGPADETNRLPCREIGCPCTAYAESHRPTPERLAEIRSIAEHFYTPQLSDALSEIDALTAEIADLKRALQPFAEMYREDQDTKRMADTCPVSWHYDMYGTQALTCGDLRRAARLFE